MKSSILAVITALFLGSTAVTFAATSSSAPVVSQNPNTHQVNLRLKSQMVLIYKGQKAGKFTPEQTKTLKMGLRAIRQKEVGFFKLNGNKELTSDQQSQLNQALNANSTTLGETPVN